MTQQFKLLLIIKTFLQQEITRKGRMKDQYNSALYCSHQQLTLQDSHQLPCKRQRQQLISCLSCKISCKWLRFCYKT